jgi:hypothetical protein
MNTQLLDLQRLAFHVGLQAKHLQETDAHLFELDKAEMLTTLQTDGVIAVRADAFIARFNRLLWNIDEKMFVKLMAYFKEPLLPMVERLAYAEKHSWLESVSDWLLIRKTRDQLTHEYEGDIPLHTDALYEAHRYLPVLIRVAGLLQQKVGALS